MQVGGTRSGWKLLLGLSIFAGLSYPLAAPLLPVAVAALWKTIPVGALAAAALIGAADADMRRLALLLGFGALGDLLLALPGLFLAGAGAFACGHLVAILLYRKHRLAGAAAWRWALALTLLALGAAGPTVLAGGHAETVPLTVYAVLLTLMAATALLSSMPLAVPVGALLFVVSDMLIATRLGGSLIGGATVHGLLTWYLYYAGQLLIFAGVSHRLAIRD